MKRLIVFGLLTSLRAGAVECKPVAGAAGLLARGATLVVGEAHGTQEIPRTFGQLACLAVKQSLPVRVGLELPPPELGALEKFLQSGDKAMLLQARPFTKKKQDGRTSAAMVELLEQLRALRQAGGNIHLALFDAQPSDPGLRSLLMAQTLASTRSEDKQALLLVLVDANEAVVDKSVRTMSTLLAQRKVQIVSLNATFASGTAWKCDDKGCGERPVVGQAGGKAPSVQLDPKLGAYNGTLYVGPITASPPAAQAH